MSRNGSTGSWVRRGCACLGCFYGVGFRVHVSSREGAVPTWQRAHLLYFSYFQGAYNVFAVCVCARARRRRSCGVEILDRQFWFPRFDSSRSRLLDPRSSLIASSLASLNLSFQILCPRAQERNRNQENGSHTKDKKHARGTTSRPTFTLKYLRGGEGEHWRQSQRTGRTEERGRCRVHSSNVQLQRAAVNA